MTGVKEQKKTLSCRLIPYGRYDVNNLDVKAIHLTNDAVQKVLESYGEHEDANKLDFDEFQRALDQDHAAGRQRKVDFRKRVWPAMVEAVRHVFNATLDGLNPAGQGRKEHCFELFGLDFMLDERGAPVLIEVSAQHVRKSDPPPEGGCFFLSPPIHGFKQNKTKPSQTKPNRTKPNRTKPRLPRSSSPYLTSSRGIFLGTLRRGEHQPRVIQTREVSDGDDAQDDGGVRSKVRRCRVSAPRRRLRRSRGRAVGHRAVGQVGRGTRARTNVGDCGGRGGGGMGRFFLFLFPLPPSSLSGNEHVDTMDGIYPI